MGRNKGTIFLSIIVGLALIGLISFVGNKPGTFLLNILMMAVIAVVVFLIVRAVMNRKGAGTSDEMKKYRQAVKQSKEKYNVKETKPKTTKKKTTSRTRKKRSNRPHLTVIEGKKNTNKDKDDRASN